MIEQSDEIVTIEEVAAYLKAGRRTVYRLAANGTIPAFKLGGTWRFQRAKLGIDGSLPAWGLKMEKPSLDEEKA